jgi:hypothetical protein
MVKTRTVAFAIAAALLQSGCVAGSSSGVSDRGILLSPSLPDGAIVRGPTFDDSTSVVILDTTDVRRFADVGPYDHTRTGCTEQLSGRTGMWVPSPDLVLSADSALVPLVDSLLRDERYHRGYVGVVIGERRLLFIRGLSLDLTNWLFSTLPEEGRAKNVEDLLMHRATVSDAGAGVWSILYDPVSRRFGRIHVSCSFAGNAGPTWDGNPLPPMP